MAQELAIVPEEGDMLMTFFNRLFTHLTTNDIVQASRSPFGRPSRRLQPRPGDPIQKGHHEGASPTSTHEDPAR